MYRRTGDAYEVFLVHPGGPYWSKKDQGAWTLPKGEYEDDEEPLEAASANFRRKWFHRQRAVHRAWLRASEER
jgi:predicted NUDIX family NTP pyrophosphohydrolase